MAKRRLSQQQQRRISEQLDRRLQSPDNADIPGQKGLVIAHHGRNLIIEDVQGNRITCTARQNIGQPVCGDRVIWHPVDGSEGVLSAIDERSSLLERPGFADKVKPVAANITRIGIVISPKPEPQELLIDSYLVAAEYLGIQPLIISNKSDLITDMDSWQQRFQPYVDIGYTHVYTSAKNCEGVQSLIDSLVGQTGILVGQSGVGKSSLINCLVKEKQQKTTALSNNIEQGQHTTSYSELFHITNDKNEQGNLIDSPGVRDFRLGHLPPEVIAENFIEFRPYLGRCKFSNCRHQQEPGCAIRQAETDGLINTRRLQSYFTILDNM